MAKVPVKTARSSKKPTAAPAKVDTKQNIVLSMLRRQDGASVSEIVEATDWQPHSVRGFFAGAVERRLGIEVINENGEDGVCRYFVAPLRS